MSRATEIRSKIKSIKSTRKITSSMEMVAASKMRKAQESTKASRPYVEKIRVVIEHVSRSSTEYQHPYFIERTPKRVGFLVVSTDRGLCGSLNNNLFKTVVESMRQWQNRDIPIEIATIGKKAEHFFSRVGGRVIASVVDLGTAPSILSMIGTVKVMLDRYESGAIDRLYFSYNQFINSLRQVPQVDLLLPVLEKNIQKGPSTDYLYEPDPRTLLNALLIRYVETLVYQGVVENVACEQAARVLAMKNASDNAAELIDHLGLMYNKARQASITQEVSEIIAGASAV